MASKAPYYYSELQSKTPPILEVENDLNGDAAQVAETPTHGFYNPLLTIEPDVATDNSRAVVVRMGVSQKKKRKKKKKKGKEPELSPEYGQSKDLGKNPGAVTPRKKHPLFFSKLRQDQRRNSEPNLYEEIPDNFKEYNACYSGSLGGFSMAQRRCSSGYPGSGKVAGSASNEVLDEVHEVQRRHALILENLNLDVETMLMPSSSGSTEQTATRIIQKQHSAEKTKYSHGSGDGHECYSTCWQNRKLSGSKLHRHSGNEYILSQADLWNLRNGAAGQNIYYKQGYHKGALKSGDSLCTLRHSGEPLYMLYDDAHRQQLLFCRGASEESNSDNIYEEVDHACFKQAGNCSDDGISCNSSNFFENDLGQSESEEEQESGSGAVSFTQKIIGKGNKRKKKKESEGLIGFTRWFSTRKKEYELEKMNKMNIRPSSEDGYIDIKLSKKQRPPLSLPPPPPCLTNEQMKRRYIVASIVDSENNYVSSLHRLIRDYKRPLEESNTPIVSPHKISTMFYRVEQILQCHNFFGIALMQCVREWDFVERIGDVFVASFSKGMVLDIYSDFINNFSLAMETAKQASKNKSAFADFLKVKQITSPDRLSFFGLMVKPVQRFPQFILLLQDLLKYTPMGHHDRMSLQLALTRLECLADALNERKRESEQHHAVKEILKNLGNKFSLKSVGEGKHYLLRQDNVVQLDMDQNGMIIKSKGRRIYLLNDLLVCVSATTRSSDGISGGERLSLKWAVPLQEVEVREDITPATNNLLASLEKSRQLASKNHDRDSADGSLAVQTLYDDLSDMVHDLEVMSRITALVSTLRRPYNGMNLETLEGFVYGIHEAIRKKDEEITMLDSCCLQLVVPTKSRSTKEVLCFQMASPSFKRDWTTDLHLAKLAMDQNNTPAWDTPEEEQMLSCKMPLFAKTFPLFSSNCITEVKCGCYYTVYARGRNVKQMQNVLCLCSSDGVNSQVSVLSVVLNQIKKVGIVDLAETRIQAMEAVPSYCTEMGFKEEELLDPEPLLVGLRETIWFGTDSRRVIVVDGQQPLAWKEMGSAAVAATVQCIKYHFQHVFIALANGCVLIFYRNTDGGWLLHMPHIVTLGTSPVTNLLPLGHTMYCSCGFKVWVLDAITREVQRSYTLQHENEGEANLLAHSGSGLWISLRHSATVCLYHTETFHHLQDINIASSANRLLASHNMEHILEDTPILVTTLLATRGLLWVGTNVGIIVTIPLPRLEGVPIITGQTSVGYHAHRGTITTLLSLQPRTFPVPCETEPVVSPIDPDKTSSPFAHPKILKQKSDSLLPSNLLGKKNHGHPHRHSQGDIHTSGAKTLPRGMTFCRQPHHLHDLIGESNDVYGLYADLMNVQDYEKDSQEKLYERLNHSDPELVHFHLTTLDRRLKHKSSRPRSWDLSNMAVSEDSDSSAASSTVTAIVSDLSPLQETRAALPTPEASNASSPKPSLGCHRNLSKHEPTQKTVLVLTGGSGYLNWRNPTGDDAKANHDSHVVVWEMKL